MEVRRWPPRREPPPGWVLSPELSELYQSNVIVRANSLSKVRRDIRAAKSDAREYKSTGSVTGSLGQIVLGALLMRWGHRNWGWKKRGRR